MPHSPLAVRCMLHAHDCVRFATAIQHCMFNSGVRSSSINDQLRATESPLLRCFTNIHSALRRANDARAHFRSAHCVSPVVLYTVWNTRRRRDNSIISIKSQRATHEAFARARARARAKHWRLAASGVSSVYVSVNGIYLERNSWANLQMLSPPSPRHATTAMTMASGDMHFKLCRLDRCRVVV